MENTQRHNVFMISERLVNPGLKYESPAIAMWLELQSNKETKLRLVEVKSDYSWKLMLDLRTRIEKEFGVFNLKDVEGMLKEIQHHINSNNGKWFLAFLEDELIGEVGVIPINSNNQVIYRLQDVDIVPEYRNRGLGNDLLNVVSAYANKNNVKALCLRADSNDWKKDWYLRYGFENIETKDRNEQD